MNVSDLPHLNAALNAVATVLILAGFRQIRRGHWRAHATLLIAATITSAAFLVSYLIYHHYAGEKSTATMTWLPPWLRIVYLGILIPHLLLAMVMVPMILLTLWRTWTRQWEKHRRIAYPTFLIWVFVSGTGVIIYGMLYHLFPGMQQ